MTPMVRLRPPARRLPRRTLVLLSAALLALASSSAVAEDRPVPSRPGQCGLPSWVAGWIAPVSGTNAGYEEQTLRVVVSPTFGGATVRVRLTNVLGDRPVVFGSATVGAVSTAPALVPESLRRLTFQGASTITVPRGGSVLTDPVQVAVRAFQPLAVSLYAAAPTGPATGHQLNLDAMSESYAARTWVASGNRAGVAEADTFTAESKQTRFVSGVEVYAPNDGAVVAFGDSITEGAFADVAYSVRLAQRLHEQQKRGGPRLAVVNAGIGGNRLLVQSTGPAGVDRFRRDALEHAGVSAVVLMEGINDLGIFGAAFEQSPPGLPTTEEITDAYAKLAVEASAAGAQFHLSPMTPAGDPLRPSQSSATLLQVQRRHEVNNWIRSSPFYDDDIDFELAVRNPSFPNWLDFTYDPGDNLHPNTAGQQQMADSIDLSAFSGLRCR